MIFSSPRPFKEALQSREVRSLMPTTGKTSDLEQLSRDIRDHAIFSATVDTATRLQAIDDGVNALLTGQADLATMRLGLKQLYARENYTPDPEKAGGLQDLSSTTRINLQIETAVDMARGYGYWAQGQQADVLDEWPAQELYRAEQRDKPREWQQRWQDAGGELFDGRMIALKTDPIWTEISRFGNPYPPFDFNSGMDVRDIARDEAVSLGLLDADTQLFPQDRGFNEDLKLSPDIRSDALKSALEETRLGRFDSYGVFIFTGGGA